MKANVSDVTGSKEKDLKEGETNGEILMNAAAKAARFSYSPYSGFKVGAALLTEDDKTYTGCNVESASYSLTVCAERTALFKAVSEGARRFKALAVTAIDDSGARRGAVPCGACRQALAEFCGNETKVFTIDKQGRIRSAVLADYLPLPFRIED